MTPLAELANRSRPDSQNKFHSRVVDILRLAVVLYLIFPFVFLLFQFRIDEWPDFGELIWAFKNSFLQAFFSSLVSLIFGLWGAFGLISFSSRTRFFRSSLEILCLVPNFLPPLFILLAVLNILDPFPMGLVGIVIVHALINFGLVAVILASVIENKMGALAELAYVEGASSFLFLRRAFFPLLKKDLFLVFLFVFVICFGSFSVPLIVGGGRGTTVEVLIYEKIRLSNHWGEAVLLAMLQSLFIFAASLIAVRGKGAIAHVQANLCLLRRPTGNFIILFCSGFYLMGYGQGLWEGWQAFGNFYEIQTAIGWSFLGSLLVGFSTGSLCFVFLMLIAFVWPHSRFERFLNGYVAPSTALTCFSLLVIGPNESFWPYLKIPLAIAMISLGSLYRMGWDGRLHALEHQINVAHWMGASRTLIFREILWPQLAPAAGLLAGLASVWGTGDFAVSRILAHQDLTVALMTETLMSSYRLNQATVLSLLVLLAGLICFNFFFWGSRVFSRKSSS